jgi:L-threonylcarbamoyladenylate synthase
MPDSTVQMTRYPTRTLAADTCGVAEAVALLASGGIAAIPTETVYGLAADAANAEAVADVYAAKGRPGFNPLIVHVADRAMAAGIALFDSRAERLADAFWPGPLTLVLPLAPAAPVASLVTAGLPTIAVRIPAHPAMQGVVRGLGRGVAAPSANASGRLSPTRAAHVLESLDGRIPLILDAGPCADGLESSIVAVTADGLVLLRHGAIPLDRLTDAAGEPILQARQGAAVSAPGMLLNHYAPRLPIRLDAGSAAASEFHIGFGPVIGDISLSASGNLRQAAARLFDLLHVADASGRAGIAVAPIPMTGLGLAINDRLRRAAMPAAA